MHYACNPIAPPRRDSAGVLVVATNTGRILLGKRSKAVGNPGTWAVFGGGIEDGEIPKEAALRELQEEAGFDASGLPLRRLHTSRNGKGTYTTFVAATSREFRPVLNFESSRAGWFSLDKLPSPLLDATETMFEDPRVLLRLRPCVAKRLQKNPIEHPIRSQDQGTSPLDYCRSQRVRRFALVQKGAGDIPTRDAYFYELIRFPSEFRDTIAFLDWHHENPQETVLMIDYMKVRIDRRGQGISSLLVSSFFDTVVEAQSPRLVDWGTMLKPHVGRLLQKMKRAYPHVEQTGRPRW